MFNQNTQYTVYSLCFSMLPSLKLTWYQSQINFGTVILKPPVAIFSKQFLFSLSLASLLPLLPLETSDHFVLPTALIVRARTANPRNFTVRITPMRCHALCLSPIMPYFLLSAAAVWLLYLPCSTNHSIRLEETNLQ
jgi:hypothetical protein